MILNLNYDKVEFYKEAFGIKETYDGDLVRLADIEFPPEMEAEEEPPTFDVGNMFVDDEVLNDSYEMREASDTVDEEEEEEEEGEEEEQ